MYTFIILLEQVSLALEDWIFKKKNSNKMIKMYNIAIKYPRNVEFRFELSILRTRGSIVFSYFA